MVKPRILYLSHAPGALYDVMRRLAGDALELVTLTADSDAERLAKLGTVDAVIVAAYPLTRPMIEAATSLKFVHHQGVGYQDTIALDALRKTSARLAITPSGTTTGVAEHAVLLALAVLRRLAFADQSVRRGEWLVNALRPESRELAGKTIGYVGMGRIGCAAAQRFRAFETSGVYFDPVVSLGTEVESALGVKKVEFDALLRTSDIITLHVPLTTATEHLINAQTLATVKLGAIIINTARGPLVDEVALTHALEVGTISGAGLDVFEQEPPDPSNPLLAMKNTVVTPHISAGTIDAFETKMSAVFGNLRRYFAGDALENEINLD